MTTYAQPASSGVLMPMQAHESLPATNNRLEVNKLAWGLIQALDRYESATVSTRPKTCLKGSQTRFNEFEDFRFFWIHPLRPFTGEVKSIDQLADEVYVELFSRIEKKTRRHLWLLLRDLAVNWIQSETQYLAIHLNSNRFSKGEVYHKLKLSYKPMTKVYRKLRDAKLISFKEGYSPRGGGEGRITRIKASSRLIECFKKVKVLEDINAVYPVLPPSRPVEIRDVNKYPLYRLPKTPEFEKLQSEVKRYNEAIAKANIDLSLIGYEHPVKVDLNQIFVRRIFSNSSLEQGGRLYGSWWIKCPSELRSRIFIDRVETTELDLKALHPILLYAEAGRDYFNEIGNDPYWTGNVEGIVNQYLTDIEKRQYRNFNKQIFMSLVNNTDESTALKSLRNERYKRNKSDREEGRELSYPASMGESRLQKLWADFKSHHYLIARYFAGNGAIVPAAMRLMKIDSDLIVRVLMKMLDYGILCLSVHDSIIVRHAHQELARQVLRNEFIAHLAELGLRVVDPRINIDQFFEDVTPFNSLVYGRDRDLLIRASWYARTLRHRYINYYPTS